MKRCSCLKRNSHTAHWKENYLTFGSILSPKLKHYLQLTASRTGGPVQERVGTCRSYLILSTWVLSLTSHISIQQRFAPLRYFRWYRSHKRNGLFPTLKAFCNSSFVMVLVKSESVGMSGLRLFKGSEPGNLAGAHFTCKLCLTIVITCIRTFAKHQMVKTQQRCFIFTERWQTSF